MTRRWLNSRRAEKLLVHTNEGTIEGVLVLVARDGLVLRAARYLEGDAGITLAGEMFVPKDKVTFVQAG